MGRLLLLGLLQGLAEFLPVSSSGHLVLLGTWLEVAHRGASLEVLLHLGTLAAVVAFLAPDLLRLGQGLAARDRDAWRLLLHLALASLPAALAGLIGGMALQVVLFRPGVTAFGFAATSLVLFTTPAPDRGHRSLAGMTPGDALLIGLAEALALVPGLSRSGITMAAARHLGFRPDEAARFSFLLAIPVILGASLLNLGELGRFSTGGIGALIMAAVAGLFGLQWAGKALRSRRAWRAFGWYTAAVALLAGLGF
jgi:undecaprenyl-diphosphatase